MAGAKALRRGLTLIELLIACAMVAILAALWFPIFAAARDRARRATCASNLHQLAVAFGLYAADCGALPDSGLFGSNPEGSWVAVPAEYQLQIERGVLWPYVRHSGIYRCPTYAAPASGARLSYAMNHLLGLLPEPAIVAPSRTPLLLEEDARSARGWGLNDGAYLFQPSPAGIDRLATHHSGGGSVLYCDGHIGWAKEMQRNGD